MMKFAAFLKKEFIENVRTYKLLVIIAVFFVFGMISPLTAKLLPVLFENIDMQGMNIVIPEPTAMDSYTQLFKNCNQMGLIVLLIVFSGTLTSEISKGTLIIMVTKGLPRRDVIFAKFVSAAAIWTMALASAALTGFLYTVYLFPNDTVVNFVLSVFCLWLFGLLLLAALIFWSVTSNKGFISLLLTGAFVAALGIADIFPKIQKYNPMRLCSDNILMLSPDYDISVLISSVIPTAAAICILILGAVLLFDKKKL